MSGKAASLEPGRRGGTQGIIMRWRILGQGITLSAGHHHEWSSFSAEFSLGRLFSPAWWHCALDAGISSRQKQAQHGLQPRG